MSNLPVNAKTLEEALQLSGEILTSIELETTSLSSCMLKASRLAWLLNDFDYQQIFQYENGGYPNYDKQSSLYQKNCQLLRLSNRTYEFTLEDNTIELHTYNESVKVIEEKIKVSESLLHNLIVKNADLNVFMDKYLILKEQMERRRSFLYEYVCTKYYELKYAKTSTDIFSRTRLIVDDHIGKIVPEAAYKFASIYDSLNSENTEGWSNAVHSCRRILQEMADVIYPPREDKVIKSKTIKLGAENYINRLMAYVEEHTDSETFENIVGSNLSYLGERLDAIYKAANKGSHETITTKEEADRYVIYTYLIIGDILSLNKDDPKMFLTNEQDTNAS